MVGHLLVLSTAAAAPDVGGQVESHLRVASTGEFLDFRDSLVVHTRLSSAPVSAVKGKMAVDLRLHQPISLSNVEDATVPQNTQPYSLRIHDAWIRSDMGEWVAKIGIQRTSWGTGFGISLLDNLNPWNLENPTRFDRRLSVLSSKLTWRHRQVHAEAVWVPWFTPAALPVAGVSLSAGAADVFSGADFGADGAEIGEISTKLTSPASTVNNSALGGRLGWHGARLDVALSWYHGRDSLPQVSGNVLLTGFQTDSNRVDVGVPFVYPRLDVGGVELQGELFADISAWGEMAVMMPSRTVAAADDVQLEALLRLGTISEIPDPTPQTVTQSGEPYVKWLVGMGRALGAVDVRLQWLHGFPTERQQADVGDYALLSTRWTINPVLRMDGQVVSDGQGALVGGGFGWLLKDAIELQLNYTHIAGPPGSTLDGFRGVSGGALGAQMAF